MVTDTVAVPAREALAERVGPALEALETNMRKVRRAVVHGRHTAEDIVDGAALKVRRYPLAAVGSAMCAGLAAGTLAGFFLGRNGRAKT